MTDRDANPAIIDKINDTTPSMRALADNFEMHEHSPA
jgi:hypothetical protein